MERTGTLNLKAWTPDTRVGGKRCVLILTCPCQLLNQPNSVQSPCPPLSAFGSSSGSEPGQSQADPPWPTAQSGSHPTGSRRPPIITQLRRRESRSPQRRAQRSVPGQPGKWSPASLSPRRGQKCQLLYVLLRSRSSS